jgi:hypothetical protein
MSSLQQILQSQDFQSASRSDQQKYLSSVDQDFAKAKPDEQSDYLDHLTGTFKGINLKTGAGGVEAAQTQNTRAARNAMANAEPSYTAKAIENAPSGADPHNPGNPNLNAIPESERERVNRDLLNTASLTTPFVAGAEAGVPGVLKAGRGLIGAGVGAGIGEAGGARVGGLFGETGRKVGGTVGAVGGGLLGGSMAAGLERSPSTMRVKSLPFGIQRGIPEWMVPGPSDEEIARGEFMNRGYKPVGTAQSAFPPVGTTGSVAGTRRLVLTPSEAASEDLMQGIAKRRASERGMQFAGGMTPREGRTVPRLPTPMAEQEFPGPRQVVRFPEDDEDEQ